MGSLTVSGVSAMIKMLRNSRIEVALFKSSFSDVSGTGEEKRKGSAPKEGISMKMLSWACIEQVYDCHLVLWMGRYRDYGFMTGSSVIVGRFFILSKIASQFPTE